MAELDVRAAQLGERVEDVSWVAERQRFGFSEPTVRRAALELLAAGSARSRLSRADAASPAADDLRRAGLIDAKGRFTPAGETVVAHWHAPTSLFDITTSSLGRTGRLTVWTGPGSVLVATTPPYGDARFGEDAVHIWLSSYDRAVSLLASWLGIAPVWTFGEESTVVSAETYARRVSAPTTAPEHAATHLAFAWGEPWAEHVVVSRAGVLTVVHAGRAGWLRATPGPEGIELVPLPTAQFFGILQRIFLDTTAA